MGLGDVKQGGIYVVVGAGGNVGLEGRAVVVVFVDTVV